MSEVSREAVEQALACVVEPHLQRDLVSAGCVEAIHLDGDRVRVELVLGFPVRRIATGLRDTVRAALSGRTGVRSVDVDVTSRIEPREPSTEPTALPGVRSEEHTSELQSRPHLVCRLLLEKKKKQKK